ncbi:MAG: beta-N-acetylhexosaminidase [Lentisphaeria bacterium]|nr:beta-N-acetylhexosaminidase [Lentisphaeria bacterium]
MPQISIIPKPSNLLLGSGEYNFLADASISYEGAGADSIASLLTEYLRPATGFVLPITEGSQGTIQLYVEGTSELDPEGFVDETYKLEVNANGVQIHALNTAGLARGIQTLRQLFDPAILAKKPQKIDWQLPFITIQDTPRFRWRGQHIDVCRYFFSVEEVCKFIDLIALHRLNVCHIHLTEDQGWRIEIKAFPKLTEVGSIRKQTLVGHEGDRPRIYDNKPYGGYFTQDDIRTIVTFAEQRHIMLIPEIDMPGHMSAAVASYPELGNPGYDVEVRCHWGISQHVLNLEESTVEFAKTVLDEVMDLFPSPYIHIGGDEAPKFEWSECANAQSRMQELGLKSENELQSWFIQQLDTHITQAGRRLIGWDEILEGGLAQNATVMSWRGEEGGVEAAKQGHQVVMTPHQHVYFDYYQAEPKSEEPLAIGGMSTTEHVYAYEPIPAALPEEQYHQVLGSQGQLWTEYIPTMDHMEYMGFPRICALSEVLWISKEEKNYTDFLERLKVHRQRLAILNVNAHPRP